jgi:hypothetical protein
VRRLYIALSRVTTVSSLLTRETVIQQVAEILQIVNSDLGSSDPTRDGLTGFKVSSVIFRQVSAPSSPVPPPTLIDFIGLIIGIHVCVHDKTCGRFFVGRKHSASVSSQSGRNIA